jgi:Uma2 family endonuclease
MRAVWLSVPESFLDERRRLRHDRKDELWDGELHMPPPSNSQHQRVSTDLIATLAPIARRLGLEVWGGSIGIYGLGDDNWRIPDVALARPDQTSERGLEHAELVVEVLSPHDESRQKLPYYAKLGVREVWLIEPSTRVSEIYKLDGDWYELVAASTSPMLGITLQLVEGPRLRLTDIDGTITDV